MRFPLLIFSFAAILPTRSSAQDDTCIQVTTQPNFNLTEFAEKRWFVHEQAETRYLPVERNFCIHADYQELPQKTFWRYTIGVNNYAEDESGKSYGGGLCAALDSKFDDPAKLVVAPCFLPRLFFGGPYWVIAYDESEGYALISGGQPTIPTKDGFCRSDPDSINESGLWIFLRSQERDQDLIDTVRDIAVTQGFDVDVLNYVNQTNCNSKIA